MLGTAQDTGTRTTALRRAARYAIASSVTAGVFLSVAAVAAPAAQAVTATSATAASPAAATARIQGLLDSPVNDTVNLPHGTFTISPTLKLRQGERIIGHGTTLRIAPGTGDYAAMLTGASTATDLSGLTITGVTFDQNARGNPIRNTARLFTGTPRFVLLIVSGTGIKISNDKFTGSDNVNTIVTGGGTHNVTISGNVFKTSIAKIHDHSTIYTSGTGTTIRNNTFAGQALVDSAAIEVHGDKVSITGNHVHGYYKAANIVASDTTFTGNHVSAAANPVDLWSMAPTALRNVTITGNVLNRNLPHWATILRNLGGSLPAARFTQQVTRNAHSTLGFHNITIHGNKS
jgi:hypothetical protein